MYLFIAMSSSSNGTSSPCKSKVDGEVIGSRPTGCVFDYQSEEKEKIIYYQKREKKKNPFRLSEFEY
jgi:hypothetical protein